MSFLYPWVFLAALPVIGGLVLLYFLRLRRHEVLVSSTLLWQRSIDDMRANAPFQRLRRNLLFLLQLLALAGLIVAAAGPVRHGGTLKGKSYFILLDNSASMQVVEADGATRAQKARSAVIEMLSGLQSGDRAELITFAARARLLVPMTRNAGSLRRGLDEVSPTHEPTQFWQALNIATNSAREHPAPVIVVVSDGRFKDSEKLASVTVDVPVRYVKIGAESSNAAITSLALRPAVATSRTDAYQLFAVVTNLSSKPIDTILGVYLANEQAISDAAEIKLPPGGSTSKIFEIEGMSGEALTLRLDGEDSLACDNSAATVVPVSRTINVLCVGETDFFLKQALTRDPAVKLASMTQREYEAKTVDAPMDCVKATRDVIIYHSFVPKALGKGRFFFVNSVPDASWLPAENAVQEAPEILDWDLTHPVTRFLSFGDTAMRQALRLTPPEDAKVLIDGSAGPLAVARTAPGVRVLVLAFDPRDSNWPLRAGFPIFICNSIHWLLDDIQRGSGMQMHTGEVGRINAPQGARSFSIVGKESKTPPANDVSDDGFAVFTAPSLAGLYSCRFGAETEQPFAVNLLDVDESNILPAENLEFSQATVAATGAGQLTVTEPLWPYFIVAALALLLVEWIVYTRNPLPRVTGGHKQAERKDADAGLQPSK